MKKKTILNLSFNILLFALEIIGLVLLFVLPLHLGSKEPKMLDFFDAVKFFTTDSNWFMLASTAIMIVCIILAHCKKIKKIPKWVSYIKLIATTCVALTCICVLFYLPLVEDGCDTEPLVMFENSNALYHLICPVVAVVDYLLFEERPDIKLPFTCFGMVPVAGYIGFYAHSLVTHVLPDGTVPLEYDWYGISKSCYQIGLTWPIIVPFIGVLVIGVSYLITLGLWWGNKKIYIKRIEK